MKVYFSFGSGLRHRTVSDALHHAISLMGWQKEMRPDNADIAIVWGMNGNHQHIMKRYKESGRKLLMIDLGYWNRYNLCNIKDCYYKITINSIHPNECFDKAYGGYGRYKETHGPAIKPWRSDGVYVLLAGMGPKGCAMYGQGHGEWDRQAITQIKQATDMPIIYRPKPSDKEPIMIDGVRNATGNEPIANLMRNAFAVVTHHGNSTLDGLWQGVPCFCADGPGLFMGKSNLAQIKSPMYPENRRDFLEKLSWFNWSFNDILNALPLKHLVDKGIL